MSTTYSQGQALVSAIAAIAAGMLDQERVVSRLCLNNYVPTATATASTTAIGANATTPNNCSGLAGVPTTYLGNTLAGALVDSTPNTLVEAPASIDLARALADPVYLNDVVNNMVKKLAQRADGDCLANYPSFTTNAVLGTGNTAITDALIISAASVFGAANLPQGADRFLVLSDQNTSGSGSGNAYAAFLALANIADQTKVGAATANTSFLKRGWVKYRGFTVIPSALVTISGTVTITCNNLAFAKQALTMVVGAQTPTSDGTHIQALSTTATSAVTVRMDFDGTDTPRIALRLLYGNNIAINGYGQQFRT